MHHSLRAGGGGDIFAPHLIIAPFNPVWWLVLLLATAGALGLWRWGRRWPAPLAERRMAALAGVTIAYMALYKAAQVVQMGFL